METTTVKAVLAEIEARVEEDRIWFVSDDINANAAVDVPRLVAALRWAIKEAVLLGKEGGQDWTEEVEAGVLALLRGSPTDRGDDVAPTTKRPMRHVDSLDWATLFCPCGASLCSRWLADEDTSWDGFKREHAPHTNGMIVYDSDGTWSKVYSEKPPVTTEPLLPDRGEEGGGES